jgi:hypothetical protein
MSNFKSGSGNLDFGGDEDEAAEPSERASQSQDESHEEPDTAPSTESGSASTNESASDTERQSGRRSDEASTGETEASQATAETYPYFVRRNNVGDERDTRLEVHVRDDVADQEAEFRNELAEHLDTSEISKTDAREFALLAAYRNPEQVAELMREEGFGTFG